MTRAAIGAGILTLPACSAGDSTGPGGTDAPPVTINARWSDPAAWGGKLPAAGAAVTIPADKAMLLDVSPPALASLTIAGALVFDEKDLALTAGSIVVQGRLQIGAGNAPYTHRALITLTGSETDPSVLGMGAKVLGVMPGGMLELHGDPRAGWARLNASATAGASQLVLDHAMAWHAGDRLVVASTDFDPRRDEEVEVASVSSATVSLAQPLLFSHYGQVQTIAGRTVDERAEVGLLTRNVTIRGDSAGSVGGFGGHILVQAGGTAHVEGVELYTMGQKHMLARYPMHWHMAGDVTGQYFANSSVWHSFNRCVTVHGSSNARVEGNVCYDAVGHGYFLEDGAETGNQILDNLGLGTKKPASGEEILASDLTPATFWITNPDNTIRGNVAAGSAGSGFWFALPAHPTGLSTGSPLLPRTTRLGVFADNEAHSNSRNGLRVDDGPRPDGTTETTAYEPREDPAGDSPSVMADFANFVAWKHPSRAVWLRGDSLLLSNAVLADNATGATFAAEHTRVTGTLFVGHSANTGEALAPGTPLRGYEFYDGTVGADAVTFVNYDMAGGIPSSALGFERDNEFPLHADNWTGQVTFVNANPVYVENPNADADGDKAAVFVDRAGAVSGTAGAWVVANLPFLTTSACALRSAWNASVCPGRYVQLSFTNEDGGATAPLTLTRDDGAAVSLVGVPDDRHYASMSVLAGRKYDATWGVTAPARLRVYLNESAAGDTVRVSFPYPAATLTAVRDYDTSRPLTAAASQAELDASAGEKYFYDGAAGRLRLKLVTQSTRDWATVEVTP
ncbi:MAG TPA: G8 domain-containing protein [Gemmatimonadales bacterium]|nr:G8 domain-containing protein [Gemmatimonadales bacterium]